MNTIAKKKERRDQIWNVDIVKGIGILLVVICHSGCPAYYLPIPHGIIFSL